MRTPNWYQQKIRPPKDAARAVKQGVHTTIEQVKGKTLTQLLDLPPFKVTGSSVEPNAEQDMLHLFCEVTLEAGLCPNCQTILTTVKEGKPRSGRSIGPRSNSQLAST